MPHTYDPDAPSPRAAYQRLIEGNRRFLENQTAAGRRGFDPVLATEPQRPFAIVLGCSDSRTPVEILFDQGFGDLFVVRIAGNIVAPSVVGSIEFAASQFGTRLVVVMGHTRCGAIDATVRAMETSVDASKNIRAITDRIAPHIHDLVEERAALREPHDSLVKKALKANVRASVDHLRHGSRLIEELVNAGRVVVVGALYELETGAVSFFDPPPAEE
ncbi:MAG: carbonic anhydrase [Myxococcota bacterium]